MKGIRRIFYDLLTGERIHEIGRVGDFILPTIEQDIATYTELSERNRETFEVLELPFSEYAKDFANATRYRVNLETKKLEFQFPDPNKPEVEQPYQRPLSEIVNEQMDYLLDVDFRLSMVELGLY